MSEVSNTIIGFRKRQSVRNHADGIDGIPNAFASESLAIVLLLTWNLPNAHEFNIDVDRECLLKGRTLLPSNFTVFGVHLVRKWDLLMIAWR